jgi:tRNA G10  N-methylase Trm11
MLYLFELGHQPHISLEEIFCVLKEKKYKFDILENKDKKVFLETKEKLDCKELMRVLGGTVKISEFLGLEIKKSIISFLESRKEKNKIVFSISSEDKNLEKKIGIEIKKELKKKGHSVRYVEIKNSASIIHNNILEKGGDFTINKFGAFVSTAIQDIEAFTDRDFNRPKSDSHSGMLPPKLARTMLNLASLDYNKKLLDPYCGSGTVVTEAIDLGFKNIIASDLSPKAIEDTKKNVDWLLEIKEIESKDINLDIFENDVQTLSQSIDKNSVDLIVFEPFMGKAMRGRETEDMILKQTEELKKLYINAFLELKKVLKKDGVIIAIIPRFNLNGRVFTIDCGEEIEDIGFKNIGFEKNKTLDYARPGQIVEREIFKFRI